MVGVEKYHGTGNDFIIVDAAEDVPDRRAFAAELCDRETGLDHPNARRRGADGVLFLALEPEYSPPRVVMTLVQPDGSVAAMCGNGARCAAKWVAERTGSAEVMIDTQAGTRRAEIGEQGVTIEMGAPTFDPDGVPVVGDEPLIERDVEGLTVTAVNTGVPHAVAFVDDVTAVDVEAVAPAVRDADVFPEGANVNFAAPRADGEDTDETVRGFDQRTFERGVEAETDSCGTGAVAIVAAAERLGKVERGQRVPAHPPGGRLVVQLTERDALLQGPVEREYTGTVTVVDPTTFDVELDGVAGDD
ncbi:diaminopimelate epimerase [Halorientalis persicus]|jgi:diaminopimelate epimerase|uniref:Diaminopimelate epimerase n=1 Tax=Halorientalis persicus TaxID=1367881 RepID=A0A1H8EVA4_9EURY|nr:diaminopimelate epimerase [Halorientalis persicus]SEN23413.1 diaminopimelate epimerase [Halorientalis persicus]